MADKKDMIMEAFNGVKDKAHFLRTHPKFAANHPELAEQYLPTPATAKANPKQSQNLLLDDFINSKDKARFMQNHPQFAANHPELAPIPGIKGQRAQNSVTSDLAANQAQATQNLTMQNPQWNTPFGSSQLTFDANGNPVFTQTLDEKQAELLKQQQALKSQSMDTIKGLLSGIKPHNF